MSPQRTRRQKHSRTCTPSGTPPRTCQGGQKVGIMLEPLLPDNAAWSWKSPGGLSAACSHGSSCAWQPVGTLSRAGPKRQGHGLPASLSHTRLKGAHTGCSALN